MTGALAPRTSPAPGSIAPTKASALVQNIPPASMVRHEQDIGMPCDRIGDAFAACGIREERIVERERTAHTATRQFTFSIHPHELRRIDGRLHGGIDFLEGRRRTRPAVH